LLNGVTRAVIHEPDFLASKKEGVARFVHLCFFCDLGKGRSHGVNFVLKEKLSLHELLVGSVALNVLNHEQHPRPALVLRNGSSVKIKRFYELINFLIYLLLTRVQNKVVLQSLVLSCEE
jgi:hypothetical protein